MATYDSGMVGDAEITVDYVKKHIHFKEVKKYSSLVVYATISSITFFWGVVASLPIFLINVFWGMALLSILGVSLCWFVLFASFLHDRNPPKYNVIAQKLQASLMKSMSGEVEYIC